MVAVELPVEITASFVAEARSYLPQMAASVARLDNAHGLSEAYRFAHTIKSSAAMLGHTGLSQVCELLEGDLECVLLGELMPPSQVAQLGRSVTRIASLLDGVAGKTVDIDAIIADEVHDRLTAQIDLTTEGAVAAEASVVEALDAVAPVAEALAPEAPFTEPDFIESVLDDLPELTDLDEVCADAQAAEHQVAIVEVPAVFVEAAQPVVAAEPIPTEESAEAEVAEPLLVQAAEAPLLAAPALPTKPQAPPNTFPLTPLLDSLAETVLALDRELEHGDANLRAHRDAVAQWLSEFESTTGLAPREIARPPATTVVQREKTARREALLREAIEAELRLKIETEVRAELEDAGQLVGTQEEPRPLLTFVPRQHKRRSATGRRHVPSPAPAAALDGLAADPEMREVFALEATEHLKHIDADVAALEAAPNDPIRLGSLRRSVHTLKGAAAMMGFGAVAALAHSLEDRLDAATTNGAGLDTAAYGVLLSDLNHLEVLIAGRETPQPLHQVTRQTSSAVPEAEAASHDNANPAAAVVPVRLEYLDELLTLAGDSTVSMSRWPALLSTAKTALIELRRTATRVDALLVELQSERHRRLEEAGDAPRGQSSIRQQPAHAAEFDALELDRYTAADYVAHELAQIAAESATIERELASSLEGAADLAESQRRHASTMQERLLGARLVPLDELIGRLQRAAKSVASRREKEVDFLFEAEGVLVDRAVLDAVADALQHIVRNAVDHGIETPVERSARGKPAVGTVCVSARQAQGEVIIEVSDDGAGIDIGRVRDAARASGVTIDGPTGVSNDDSGTQQMMELIFRPGLSTAEAVDDVSGRGVGLDVVAAAMSRINGTVDVASEPGAGTVFGLRFPVTLAQARVVMAEASGSPIAIPAANVKHVARLADLSLEQAGGRAVTRLGGQPFPVSTLASSLGLPDDASSQHNPPVLFVEAGGRRAAWIASEVGSHQDVVVKSLGAHLGQPRGVAGATLLEDGRVALLVYPPDLLGASSIATAWQRSPEDAWGRAAGRRQAPAGGDLRVLVVDDSPTIRKLLVRMLRDLGWLPIEAKDGADALEAIRLSRPDIVLADIEMPRLDGYGLLTALRSQPATADLPVLMLTSRTADRHRQRAMELGANGYLTKPYRPDDVAAALRRLGTRTPAVAAVA